MKELPPPLKQLFERLASAQSVMDGVAIEKEAEALLPDFPIEDRYLFRIHTAALLFGGTPKELDAEIAEEAGSHDIADKMALYERFESKLSKGVDGLTQALDSAEKHVKATLAEFKRIDDEMKRRQEREKRLGEALRSPHVIAGPGPSKPQ